MRSEIPAIEGGTDAGRYVPRYCRPPSYVHLPSPTPSAQRTSAPAGTHPHRHRNQGHIGAHGGRIALLLLLAAAALGNAAADPSPALTCCCTRAVSPPVIDGRLDDPAWTKPAWVTNYAAHWPPGDPAHQAWRVAFLWDNDALYVAACLADIDLRGSVATPDESIVWRDERVEFYLDANPGDDIYRCWEFTTTGYKLDYEAAWGRRFHNGWETKGLVFAVRLDGTLQDDAPDRGYTVEARIPFDGNFPDAARCPPHPGDRWGLGVYREDQRRTASGAAAATHQSWRHPGTKRADFHLPETFGWLLFAPPANPRNVLSP